MKKIKTYDIVLSSSLAAISILLELISVETGTTKFSLYGFPILISGMLFGPLVGSLTGIVVGFVTQLVSQYGLTITTPLWMLAPLFWGLVSGIFSLIFKKQYNSILRIACVCISTSLAVLGINTLALYLDGLIMGYNTAFIIAQLAMRIGVSLALTCVYTILLYFVLPKLDFSLRKK